MRRKREIQTQQIYKWNIRLNVGGHRQRKYIDYDPDTYSTVVAWPNICTYLIFVLLNKWKTRQLDFVLAYPHATVEREIFMHIPRRFHIPTPSNKKYVLKILQNIYGTCQAGKTWFLFSRHHLITNGFKQSKIYPCVFFYRKCFLLIYVDDVIIGASTDEELNDLIEIIKDNVYVEDQGDICNYVGVHFSIAKDGSYELRQPHLISSVLKDLGLDETSKTAPTPA